MLYSGFSWEFQKVSGPLFGGAVSMYTRGYGMPMYTKGYGMLGVEREREIILIYIYGTPPMYPRPFLTCIYIYI